MSDTRKQPISYVTWAILAFLAFGIYQVFFVGSPANKKFLDDCHARGTAHLTSNSPDEEYRRVIVDCQSKLREFKRSN